MEELEVSSHGIKKEIKKSTIQKLQKSKIQLTGKF